MSGIPEILSASRNDSAGSMYEIVHVFSIAPAMSWPRWLVMGYFTAETRVRSQTSHFGFVDGEVVMGRAFLPQILRCPFTHLFN